MNNTPDVLRRILERKRQEVTEQCAACPLDELKTLLRTQTSPVRGFASTLGKRIKAAKPGVIAEIKRASPSKGLLRADFVPTDLAKSYAKGGATCLSVLTDQLFFQGNDADLSAARTACTLPVLRKEFIIDPYQIYQSRIIGADAILLIAACLDDLALNNLINLAHELALDVLLEVHNDVELTRALKLQSNIPDIIGINNRNLHNFEVDLNTTLDLAPKIPSERLLVTESGILERQDVDMMRAHGIHGFLVGETMMRAANPGERLAELFLT